LAFSFWLLAFGYWLLAIGFYLLAFSAWITPLRIVNGDINLIESVIPGTQ
jgi:hypothetical protein